MLKLFVFKDPTSLEVKLVVVASKYEIAADVLYSEYSSQEADEMIFAGSYDIKERLSFS